MLNVRHFGATRWHNPHGVSISTGSVTMLSQLSWLGVQLQSRVACLEHGAALSWWLLDRRDVRPCHFDLHLCVPPARKFFLEIINQQRKLSVRPVSAQEGARGSHTVLCMLL